MAVKIGPLLAAAWPRGRPVTHIGGSAVLNSPASSATTDTSLGGDLEVLHNPVDPGIHINN